MNFLNDLAGLYLATWIIHVPDAHYIVVSAWLILVVIYTYKTFKWRMND